MSQAANVVTSENLAEWTAQKLGLATEEAPTEVVEEATEPVENAEGQSEPTAENEEKPTEERKTNPKLEKRFSELTKQREQLRKEAEAERSKREELENRIRELEGRSQPKAVEVDMDAEPQPSQFQDAFEYAKALAEYSAEKALKDRDRQEAERKANEERATLYKSWNEKLEATKAELPDYEEMIASSDVVVSDQIRDAILESDVGPKILYHLAENPEVAQALNSKSVISALREIGKLEARFEKAEPKEEAKREPVVKASKAPAPINPIKGSAGSVEVADTDKMTYQQWKAYRMKNRSR